MSRPFDLAFPLVLGFDDLGRAPGRVTKAGAGCPPYAIERLQACGNAPERLRITLAEAAFARDELAITVEANHRQGMPDGEPRTHRGIAARQFQRAFLMAEGRERQP